MLRCIGYTCRRCAKCARRLLCDSCKTHEELVGGGTCTMSRLRSFSVQWMRICSKWTSLNARCSSVADDVECSNGNAPSSITNSSTPHAHTSAPPPPPSAGMHDSARSQKKL